MAFPKPLSPSPLLITHVMSTITKPVENDMAEFVTTLGFPSWGTIEHPCPLCFCTKGDWDRIAGLSPVSLPWLIKTFAAYEAACALCERWVTLATMSLLYRVRAALEYDKRKGSKASRGRALKTDIPELGLLAGDRLEPHPTMPDVGVIDDFKAVPVTLLFWRRSEETQARHRNPLFDALLGITPEEIFVPDWLHSLSLGVYKRTIIEAWHKMFGFNVFDVDASQRAVHHVFIESCVGALREKLFQWYRTEEAAKRKHTRVQLLTVGMVGLSSGHQLGSHGSETNGLLLFTNSLLAEFSARIPDAQWKYHMTNAMSSLVANHHIIKEYRKGMLPIQQTQQFTENWKRHVQSIRALELNFTPKHHQVAHMCNKMLKYGSPHAWGTWVEEGENHEVALMGGHAHRSVWARRLLTEHRVARGVRRRTNR